MARKVKCKYCGKEIENPYKVTVNGENQYYCNEEEYKFVVSEKEYYQKILEICKEILGYKTFNSIAGKEIKELHSQYTYEKIYACLNQHKQDIILYIDLKNIDKEYNRIKYMFAIIKNHIADIQIEYKKNEVKDNSINIEEFNMFDYKYKPTKQDNFLDFLE